MKKQVHLLAALFLVCSTLFAAASPGAHLIVRFEKGVAPNTIQVQVANLQKTRTRIAIQDLSGKVWFSEYVVKEDGYAKNLNLSGMPQGQYVVFVKNARTQCSKTFRFAAGEIVFFEPSLPQPGQSSVIFDAGSAGKGIARIAAGAQSLRVQLANLGAQGALIRLCGLGGNLVLEHKAGGHTGFAKTIDLAGLDAGAYFLLVQSGSAALVQQLELSDAGIQLGALEQMPVLQRPDMVKN